MPSDASVDLKPLELDTRRKIFELVRKYAGSHFREIERKSKLATGTVRYHLNYLVRSGLVSESKAGNTIRYYPKEFRSDNKKLLGLLRQKSVRNIFLCILSHDRCNHNHIVRQVNLSPSTVSWHLKKLEEEEIIESLKKGTKTTYTLLVDKEEVVHLLITYQKSFVDSLVDNVVEMWGD